MTELDLRTICNALGSIKTKWFVIGIQLGIPLYKLEEFKGKEDPFSAAVDYWFRGEAEESGGLPVSWKSIVVALRSEHVGNPALAETIRKKYCQDPVKLEEGNDYFGI